MGSKYIKYYVILGSALTILLVALFSLALPDRMSLPAVVAPMLFAALSIVAVKIMERPQITSFLKFSNAFMLTNLVKLLADLVFVVVSYLNIERQCRFSFVAVVFLVYIIFAVVDTMVLLRMFKNNDSQPK